MDGSAHSISPGELYAMPGAASAPALLYVRQRPLSADDRLIVGAHHSPIEDARFWHKFPRSAIVFYCDDGRDTSPNTAFAVGAAGINASTCRLCWAVD